MIGELSATERKLAAVMIVELANADHTAQGISDIVEAVVLKYRDLKVARPGVWVRAKRFVMRLLLPFQ